MSEPSDKRPGGLVVDFAPVQDFDKAMTELERAWQALPPVVRGKLSRLVWLHPSGDLVLYRPPAEPDEER